MITLEGFSIPVVTPIGPAPPPPGNASRDLWGDVEVLRESTSNGAPRDFPVMCGQYDVPPGEEVTVQTPYFPNKYPQFKCTWIFTSASKEGFLLNCPEFMLGRGDVLTTLTINEKKSFKSPKSEFPLCSLLFQGLPCYKADARMDMQSNIRTNAYTRCRVFGSKVARPFKQVTFLFSRQQNNANPCLCKFCDIKIHELGVPQVLLFTRYSYAVEGDF
ncbi:uncharacterized protein LOC122243990 [Penaeus japonicus]|uniref:uncharacterized protein LOC122243990 n=1 Tax=Penaeus japonicus TaxID=27405 RepID=UPI001C710876|nr:uncharacterized protein LOC122243990 [Penaeus japonicus]